MAQQTALSVLALPGQPQSFSAKEEGSLSITPSRTGGLAPLSVYFDTDITVAGITRPFHELLYLWDFDDDQGETWEYSGMRKAVDWGPTAGHLYKDAGTYTPTCYAYEFDDDGNQVGSWSVSTTITVTDTWSSTIVVSDDGDFTDAPSGTQVTETSWNDVIAYQQANRQILLKPGGSWTCASRATLSVDGPGLIDSWDHESDVTVLATSSSVDQLYFNHADDWRICNVIFDADGNSGIRAFHAQEEPVGTCQSDHVLIYRCTCDETDTAAYMCNSHSTGLAIIECSSINPVNSSWYQSSGECLFMGNKADEQDNTPDGHAYRMLGGSIKEGGVISHNKLGGVVTGHHAMKIHANEGGNDYTGFTSRLTMRGNVVDSDSGTYPVDIGPESSQSYAADEHVFDVIFESNIVTCPDNAPLALLGCTDTTARNNVLIGPNPILIASRVVGGEDFTLENIWLYNNTGYYSGASAFTFCSIDDYDDIYAYNNLSGAPSASSVTGFSDLTGNLVESNNSAVADAGFVEASPSEPVDFRLASDSDAVDAGTYTHWSPLTFGGDNRLTSPGPYGSSVDQGAWEVGADHAPFADLAEATATAFDATAALSGGTLSAEAGFATATADAFDATAIVRGVVGAGLAEAQATAFDASALIDLPTTVGDVREPQLVLQAVHNLTNATLQVAAVGSGTQGSLLSVAQIFGDVFNHLSGLLRVVDIGASGSLGSLLSVQQILQDVHDPTSQALRIVTGVAAAGTGSLLSTQQILQACHDPTNHALAVAAQSTSGTVGSKLSVQQILQDIYDPGVGLRMSV